MLCYVNLEAIKFFFTKSRGVVRCADALYFVATRHSGEDVKIYPIK